MSPDQQSAAQLAPAVAPSLLREMNQRLLLDHLFTHGPATRPQLARDVGLSLPTVIAALKDLASADLVRTAGRPETAQGRPALLYRANFAAGHVVGVDVGRSWLHVLVTDLAGGPLSRLDVRNAARSSAALVRRISTAVAEATREAGLTSDAITHTVIASPGVYDRRRGRVLYAANLPGWQRVGLAEALTERLGTSTTVDNDANLAAIGEHIYGAGRNVEHFVYVHIGTGLGLGLILNGRLYPGFTGAAGEAGYLPIGPEVSRTKSGRPQRGFLEESLSADAVIRYAREAGFDGKVSAEHIFAAAREGDQRAQKALRGIATHLAELVASIVALLDPQLIVLGGGIGQNLDLLEPDTRAALSRLTPMDPKLIVGELGGDAVVRGAIATGIGRAKEIIYKTKIRRSG